MASRGYPQEPKIGAVIEGLDEAQAIEGVQIFLGAVRLNNEDQPTVAGGRVVTVTGLGSTFSEARARALMACELVRFEGKHYRGDIPPDWLPA